MVCGKHLVFSSGKLPKFNNCSLFDTCCSGSKIVPNDVDRFPCPMGSIFGSCCVYPLSLQATCFMSSHRVTSESSVCCLHAMRSLKARRKVPFCKVDRRGTVLNNTLLLGNAARAISPRSIALGRCTPRKLLVALCFSFSSSRLASRSMQELRRFVGRVNACRFSRLEFSNFTSRVNDSDCGCSLSRQETRDITRFLHGRNLGMHFNVRTRKEVGLSPRRIGRRVRCRH